MWAPGKKQTSGFRIVIVGWAGQSRFTSSFPQKTNKTTDSDESAGDNTKTLSGEAINTMSRALAAGRMLPVAARHPHPGGT
jgi:hypothetical protein